MRSGHETDSATVPTLAPTPGPGAGALVPGTGREPLAPGLVIPEALKPRDGRFGSGPSKIRDAQLAALSGAGRILGTSHRQAPVKGLVRSVLAGLRELLEIPETHEIALGNGGAAAFWDIATAGLVQHRIAHQVCGEFSHRFAESTRSAPFLGTQIIDSAEYGSRPANAFHAEADAYAWAQNETSTGVVTPTRRPAGATQDQITIVDGVSGAGAIVTDFSQADVYYFSPQKAFSSEGGLWFAVLSPAAVERAHRVAERRDRWIPPFLSLPAAIENSRKGQTYNTPSITSLILMADQIEWMCRNGGLRWAAGQAAYSSDLVYSWAEAHPHMKPFVRTPEHRSPVTCVIDVDETIDAPALAQVLRSNGILDVEPYRTVSSSQLRIATFPSVEFDDVRSLLDSIDWILSQWNRT